MLLEGKSYNILLLQLSQTLSVEIQHKRAKTEPMLYQGLFKVLVGNTFHASDHTDTTSPASSETNGGGGRFSQRLLRVFLTAAALPVGTPTAPQGKYSSPG